MKFKEAMKKRIGKCGKERKMEQIISMKINVRIILNKNHGMDAVRLSIDSGCWPPEDIVIKDKLGICPLVD